MFPPKNVFPKYFPFIHLPVVSQRCSLARAECNGMSSGSIKQPFTQIVSPVSLLSHFYCTFSRPFCTNLRRNYFHYEKSLFLKSVKECCFDTFIDDFLNHFIRICAGIPAKCIPIKSNDKSSDAECVYKPSFTKVMIPIKLERYNLLHHY